MQQKDPLHAPRPWQNPLRPLHPWQDPWMQQQDSVSKFQTVTKHLYSTPAVLARSSPATTGVAPKQFHGKLLDWCGNQGGNAMLMAGLDSSLNVTVLDLPTQCAKAKVAIEQARPRGGAGVLRAVAASQCAVAALLRAVGARGRARGSPRCARVAPTCIGCWTRAGGAQLASRHAAGRPPRRVVQADGHVRRGHDDPHHPRVVGGPSQGNGK